MLPIVTTYLASQRFLDADGGPNRYPWAFEDRYLPVE
jgi:CO dehydrogenase/acetyl-CoA synthase beta subunit